MAKLTKKEKDDLIEQAMREGEVNVQIQAMIGSLMALCVSRGIFTEQEFLDTTKRGVPYYRSIARKQLEEDIEEYEIKNMMEKDEPNGGRLN